MLLRQQQEKNKLRQYSVELGLRTHRPSAVTPSFEPYNTSVKSSLAAFSVAAQYENTNDWWELPKSSSVNYEQRTRSVAIAHSTKDIYKKANVLVDQEVSDRNINSRKFNSKVFQHDSKSSEYYERPTSFRKNADSKAIARESVVNSLKFDADKFQDSPYGYYEAPSISSTQTRLTNTSAGHDFLSYAYLQKKPSSRNELRNGRIRSSNENGRFAYNGYKGELDNIKFRTFEEARYAYPDTDSDESQPSDGDTNRLDNGINTFVNDIGGFANETNRFISPEPKENNLLETPVSIVNESFSEESSPEEIPDEAGQLTVSGWLANQNKVIYPSKDLTSRTGAHRASPDNVSTPQSASITTTQLASTTLMINDVEVDEVQPDLTNNEVTRPRASQDEDNILCPAEDFQIAEPNKLEATAVPPIDLSQLSRNYSKIENQTKETKLKPNTKNDKIRPKSAEAVKTAQIVKDIKKLMQGKPKEIAREIKRRVESKKTTAFDSSKNCSSSKDIKAEEEQRHKDSRRSSILHSFRGYDKYNILSPKIQSGDISVWSCLPDELWLKILSYLPANDLFSFTLVCSDFNRLAHDRCLWRNLRISKKQLSDDEMHKIGLLKPKNLSILQCTGTKPNGDMVTNYGMMSLFRECGKSLSSLSISSCIVPPMSGEALLHHAVIHCPSIKVLDVSWCNITDSDLDLITESFLDLTDLYLNGNQALTDKPFINLCTQFSGQLKTLELQGCFKVTVTTLISISQCTNLVNLNLGLCHKLSSNHLATYISKLTDLESLSLKGLKQVKDSCVSVIVRHCQKIRQLSLPQCTSLTSKAATDIACYLQHLDAVDMSSCKDCINDASLTAFLANCNGLMTLDLSSTPITNQSLNIIAINCTKLYDLRVNFCRVTEVAVTQLVESLQRTLSTLQIYGVKGMDNANLHELYPQIQIFC